MIKDIDSVLSLTYEIEGLLLLVKDRGTDSSHVSIYDLLKKKASQLAVDLGGVPERNAETKPMVKEPDETSESQDETESTESQTEETDMEKLAETVEYEQEEDSEPEAGNSQQEETKLDEAQAEEDEMDSESAEMSIVAKNNAPEINRKKKEGAQMLKMLTLNDRFRFRRELFGGSDTAMVVTLEEVSNYDNIYEVKKYLMENCGLTADNQILNEFVETIAPFFK